MGLDNVAVQWPRTGRFYEPVAPAEFVDFATLAEKVPATAGPAAALADHIAETGTVRATGYTQLVDLLLGLNGVLYATEGEAEDEDPVIDPDGCAWIAGGLCDLRWPPGRPAAALARGAAGRPARRAGRAAAVELHPHRAVGPGQLLPPLRRPGLRGLRRLLIPQRRRVLIHMCLAGRVRVPAGAPCPMTALPAHGYAAW